MIYLPSVVNYLFHVFAAARLKTALFCHWTDQQSGIHCQMIFKIPLLTPTFYAELENTRGGTPCGINVIYAQLKSMFNWLQFCQY